MDYIKELDMVFGSDSVGATPKERALTSSAEFVRSQDELSLYKSGATGRRLKAWEALDAFGFEVLKEIFHEGSAIIVESKDEPSRSFKARRNALNMSLDDLSDILGIDKVQLLNIEESSKKNPIRLLETLAQHLGLDDRKITFQRDLNGDNLLALRLRSLHDNNQSLSPKAVLSFTEAAWIIATEERLRKWTLDENPNLTGFSPNSDYGDAQCPAFRIGYDLALKTRNNLRIPIDSPIENLRDLCINKLKIPVIQCELQNNIAGATVVNNASKGIVVNINGDNQSVWVRRATIAHELGHLLWDPEPKLERVRVDKYTEIECDWTPKIYRDYVEQRANAFAAEFLAPKEASAKEYQANGLRAVMEKFGVSFSLARWQVWNGLHNTIDFEEISVLDVEPSYEWTGRESFTTDYFPVTSTPISRRGFFAALVILAEKKNMISKDTAFHYLNIPSDYETYDESSRAILSLFDLS